MEPTVKYCFSCDSEKSIGKFTVRKGDVEKKCTDCKEKEKVKGGNRYYFVRHNDGPKLSDEFIYKHTVDKVVVKESIRFAKTAEYKCKGCGEYQNIIKEFQKHPKYPLGFYGLCKTCDDTNYPNHGVTPSTNYDTPPCLCDPIVLKRVELAAGRAYHGQNTSIYEYRNSEGSGDKVLKLQVFDITPKILEPTIYKANSYRLHINNILCTKCNSPSISATMRVLSYYQDAQPRGEGNRIGLHPVYGGSGYPGREDCEKGGFYFKCSNCELITQMELNKAEGRCYVRGAFQLNDTFFNNGGRIGRWKRCGDIEIDEGPETITSSSVTDDVPCSEVLDAPSHLEVPSVASFIDFLKSGHHITNVDGRVLITGNGGAWRLSIEKFEGIMIDLEADKVDLKM